MTTIAHGRLRPAPARPQAALPARTRTPRTVRTNRVVLGFVGSLLLLSGIVGLLAGTGQFGSSLSRDPVLSDRADDLTRNSWFWPAAGIAAAVVGLLALRWLALQFRTNRLRILKLDTRISSGRTTVRPDAIANALEREIEAYFGVSRARARFSSDRHGHQLTLIVTVEGPVAPNKIRRDIAERALTRLRSTLREATPPTELELIIPAKAHRILA